MDSLKEAKVQAVSRWLKNHVVPQDAYDGMTSFAMAASLLDVVEGVEIEQEERFNELQVIHQYQDVQ